MSWARGRTQVERLLDRGDLERIRPSTEVAARLMADARAHLRLASSGIDDDPAGALQLSYDAARKSAAALLAVQGLRATARGGHVAGIDAIRAQFDGPGERAVFGTLNGLRRRRNMTEYPSEASPGVTTDDALQALSTARTAMEAAQALLGKGALGPFA